MCVRVCPSKLGGTLCIPPSKSMAHRLLVCAALAEGTSHIARIDSSEDILATSRGLSALGASVLPAAGGATVRGQLPVLDGGGENSVVDCGESGSTLRFLIPLFALKSKTTTLVGAERLFERPLGIYEDIFRAQGLPFAVSRGKLTLNGPLKSGRFQLEGNVSSQFISGLLFALPLLSGNSTIEIAPPFESKAYVELTRQAQACFGVHSSWADSLTLHIPGGQRYRAADAEVEGDWSQAGVPAVLAAVRGPLRVEGLRAGSAQGDRVLLDILGRCGACAGWEEEVLLVGPGQDPLASPGKVDLANWPDLGPILCTLALFCSGTTRFVNAGRLRIKESDRIAAMETELKKLGGRVVSTQDSMTVEGGHPLCGGVTVDAHKDHRVVMALTTAALCAGIEVVIDGAQAVAKSWPSFFEDIERVGAKVEKL